MSSEDVFDLLVDFPLHLKTEPLDDLFDTGPKLILNKEIFEAPASLLSYDEEQRKSSPKTPASTLSTEEQQTKCSSRPATSLFSFEGEQKKASSKIPATSYACDGEQMRSSPKKIPESRPKRNHEPKPPRSRIRSESSPRPTESDSSSKSSVVTSADDTALVEGSPVNTKTSKLHPYEDFHSFLIREGGIERERLARLVSSQEYPRPDEDFVSFLARSIGIKDEQYVTSLRQALRCEPLVEFTQPQVPVKMEVDQTKLEVGPDEDAVSFFMRAGSWDSTSSVDEELAFVGLEEDEDAESFLRRTGNLSSASLEFESLEDVQFLPAGMSSFLTAKQELEALTEQVLMQVSSPSEPANDGVLMTVRLPGTPEDMEGVMVNRKRRSSELE